MLNEILLFIGAIARLACIGFVVVAGMTIPEAWNLISETTYTKENNTVYVPIETCKPLSILLDSNITIDFSDNVTGSINNCHTLKYFINASVASMIFAGVAILMFILFDFISRYFKGIITRSSVLGMSLFLTFILIQTAACSYALYNECKHWEDYYTSRFDELERSEVDEVRTYANKFFFFLTSILALVSAGLLLLDSILGLCVRDGATKNNKNSSNVESCTVPTNPVSINNNDAKESYDNDVPDSTITEQPVNPKSWTNY
jgi:hypothetical protein